MDRGVRGSTKSTSKLQNTGTQLVWHANANVLESNPYAENLGRANTVSNGGDNGSLAEDEVGVVEAPNPLAGVTNGA